MKVDQPQQRPPGFTYSREKRSAGNSDRELHAEAIPLTRLAVRFGTPLYVYSAATIRERYREFDLAFRGCEHTICYSVKANSNLSILRMLARLGAGFDIVSGGELQRVIAAAPALAKESGEKQVPRLREGHRAATTSAPLGMTERGTRLGMTVVFSGVGKLAEEIDQALQAGILLFNVESASELELLAARAAHHRKPAQFAVRVNPDVAAKTHPYISTGLHQHKFGVPWRDATALYRRGAEERWLKPSGVSVHIGSQITDVDPFRETMERVAALVRSLREAGLDIRYVDAGGGLGISYDHRSTSNFSGEVKRYAEAVMQPLKGLGVHLLLEPGRAIIAPAGALLTRVVYRKQNDGKRFVVVDAAMNDLLRPSLYDAYHEIVPVMIKPGRKTRDKADIVGPVCESGDFFARDREVGELDEGDLLAILDAGAYGMSLASNYNTRPRAAEVLVDGKRARVVRRRETVADLLAPEVM
ncbi:MAG: diaminopimelate decarboxylase [Candidatus Korobacteraceae bacterium]